MDAATQPRIELARSVLPPPLLAALEHLAAQAMPGAMLVGGTALSGFYAGHRRSDDLDLFCQTDAAHRAMVLSVQTLRARGAELDAEFRSGPFYRTNCLLDGHRFTIDVVLDAHLFEVGTFLRVGGIDVASLETLMMTKAATLVSRCSEKDLYDLSWILAHRQVELVELLEMGRRVDGGMNAEAVLMVVSGTRLSKDACDFALDSKITPRQIFAEVTVFKDELERNLVRHLDGQPVPPLGKLVAKLRGRRRPRR